MATEITSVETALYNSVKAIFPSTTVIFANQDSPEPTGTYIYILPISINHVGRTYASTLTDTNEKLHIRQEYEVDVRFGFIGSNADNLALDFSAALQNVYYSEQWQNYDLSLRDRRNIFRVPQTRETRYTKHYTIQARFGFAVRTLQTVPVIETIVFNDIEINPPPPTP